MHDSDSYAGVLAHSQTSKENNREAELSLENKGHNIIVYYCIVLIINILLLCIYPASIAPCCLHTPILPALLHLWPSECSFSFHCHQRLARSPQLSSEGNQGESSRAREKRHSSSADFS